jgi:hypothetical protein
MATDVAIESTDATSGSDRLAHRLTRSEERVGLWTTSLLVGMACFVLSLLVVFPTQPVYVLFGRLDPANFGDMTASDRFYGSYLPLSQNPATQLAPAWSYTQHRILGPLIAYGTFLRGTLSPLVPVIANYFILCLSYRLLRRHRCDVLASVMITATLGTTLIVATSQSWAGFQDSLGFLFILVAMSIRQPVLVGAMFAVAMLADERTLSAVPLVLTWHLITGPAERRWKQAMWMGVACTVAAALWAGYYLWLRRVMQLDVARVANSTLMDVRLWMGNVWPGYFFALRAAWLLPLVAILRRGRAEPLHVLLMVASIVPILGLAVTVGDISRVAATAFPAVFIGCVMLRDWTSRDLRILAAYVLLLNLFTPVMSVTGFFYRFLPPAPYAVPALMQRLR